MKVARYNFAHQLGADIEPLVHDLIRPDLSLGEIDCVSDPAHAFFRELR